MSDLYVAKKAKEEKKILSLEEELGKIWGKTKNPLASFLAVPPKIRFETQDPEEKIILLLRKHWITNVGWLTAAAILLVAPLALNAYPLLNFMPARFQLFTVILWYLFIIIFILEQFLTWFFNVYIVTDERIIDIDFYNLLYKQITEAKIDKVQDITMRMGGAIRTLFNFGDVLIQTAGAQPNLDFSAVPKPEQVVRVLQDLRTQEEVEAIEGRVR